MLELTYVKGKVDMRFEDASYIHVSTKNFSNVVL